VVAERLAGALDHILPARERRAAASLAQELVELAGLGEGGDSTDSGLVGG
jgi:hypothetical protein